MANRSCNRRRASKPSAAAPAEPARYTEPAMKRWPHPVPGPVSAPAPPDPMLHYIRCALAYQNELLSEIKTLLEELAAAREEN